MIADPTDQGEVGNQFRAAEQSRFGPFVVVPTWLLSAPVSGDAIKLWCILAHWMDRDERVTMVDLRLAMNTSQQRINKLLVELESVDALCGHAEQGYVVFYARPTSQRDVAA